MKTVLFLTLCTACVLQLTSAGPLQQQFKVDARDLYEQVAQHDFDQVTDSKLATLPETNGDSEPSTIRIDEGGLIPTESVPELEQDETEQEVQQVQQQDFQEVQDIQDVQDVQEVQEVQDARDNQDVKEAQNAQEGQDVQDIQKVQWETTTDDNSNEDVQSTESVEDQSNESWFCSVFGCNKS